MKPPRLSTPHQPLRPGSLRILATIDKNQPTVLGFDDSADPYLRLLSQRYGARDFLDLMDAARDGRLMR